MSIFTQLEMHIQKEIGQDGKNSQVYQITDPQLGATLAVKKLDIKQFANPAEYFEEARLLYDSRHTNIVEVKYASKDSKNIYIAMPFYKNGSLKDLMGTRFLTVRDIIKISIDFLSGLNHIHSKKLVHFDIKPSNILFDDSSRALVGDFGLSKHANEFGIADQENVYLRLLPPETLEASGRSHTSDIYQVGMTLYRMCNGEVEFEKQIGQFMSGKELNLSTMVKAVDKEKFPCRNSYKKHIPLTLKKVVHRAIAPKVNDRYQSVIDLMNDLARIDVNLDWQYSEIGGQRLWERTKEHNKHTIEINQNRSVFDVLVTKKDINTDRVSNDHVNSKKGLDTLEKALNHAEKSFKTLG